MLIRKWRESYVAQPDGLGTMCRGLLNRIPVSEQVASLVFYGGPQDAGTYFYELGILHEILCSVYGESVPPFSYIPQKPLTGGLILEVCLVEKMAGTVIAFKEYSGIRYLTIQNDQCRELITGGCISSEITGDTFQQASAVFGKISAIFSREGLSVNSIFRQWNYIGEITGHSGGLQNYHQFNRARSHFYDQAIWENGYPAASATGIGVLAGAVIVRIEALEAALSTVTNMPINNTLQVAAHRYSAEVLAGNDKTLYAPRFERARLLGADGNETIYLSGTAAIRGEKSMAESDAVEQTRITLENIINLCPGQTAPVFEILIIYLKCAQDFSAVKAFIDQSVRAVSSVFVEADLCRDGLLVEIEGVAKIKSGWFAYVKN